MKRILILCSFVFLLSICHSIFASPQTNRSPDNPGGIFQLVNERNGRVSCWGVVIQLGNMTFKKNIMRDQIEISEGKHGHDLRDIMTWKVAQTGKRLKIEFKAGMGDFGSGNRVEVRIDRSAFKEPMESGNKRFIWSIDTDTL